MWLSRIVGKLLLRALQREVRLQLMTWLENLRTSGTSLHKLTGQTGPPDDAGQSPSTPTTAASRRAFRIKTPAWWHLFQAVGCDSFYAVLTTPWGMVEVTGDRTGIEVSVEQVSDLDRYDPI
jgi:hypothetical protein